MTAKDSKRNPQTVTTGSVIRMEEPSSKRGQHKSVATVLVPDEFVGGFINFLREYAVVGVAIGFVIGIQAQALMKSLIDSFINPAFSLFFGDKLSQRTFVLHFHGHQGTFSWGAFVYALINF